MRSRAVTHIALETVEAVIGAGGASGVTTEGVLALKVKWFTEIATGRARSVCLGITR